MGSFSCRSLPCREHDPALRTLHLSGADPLDLGWRDRVAAGWTGGDGGAVDFVPAQSRHPIPATLSVAVSSASSAPRSAHYPDFGLGRRIKC